MCCVCSCVFVAGDVLCCVCAQIGAALCSESGGGPDLTAARRHWPHKPSSGHASAVETVPTRAIGPMSALPLRSSEKRGTQKVGKREVKPAQPSRISSWSTLSGTKCTTGPGRGRSCTSSGSVCVCVCVCAGMCVCVWACVFVCACVRADARIGMR